MAKKDSALDIRESWLDLSKLEYPDGISANEVTSVISATSVRINLSIPIPSGAGDGPLTNFKLSQCPPVKRLRGLMEKRVVESMQLITDARKRDGKGDTEAYTEAEKCLKSLNDYLKKSFQELRPLIREGVARELGTGVKANDLQSFGSINFKEYSIKPGTFANELEVESTVKDLSKAFTRRGKWFCCGLAWKGEACVVSVKPNKDFTASELKELREELGPTKSTGANTLGCHLRVMDGKNIELSIAPEDKRPKKRAVKNAIMSQAKKNSVEIIVTIEKWDKDEKKKNKKKKTEQNPSDAKQKGTAKTK